MADKLDFFAEEEQKAQEEIQKIKLGDTEYEPTELEQMVAKGKKVDEYEKKYNTDFDKAWSGYGKATQENKTLKEELESLRQAQSVSPQPNYQQLTEDQKIQARTALSDILGGKPMTDKELDNWYQNRRAGERLIDECKELAGEIDGSDGRPKFDVDEVLGHMKETGIRDPMKAYKDKYEPELDVWKQSELSKSKGMTLPTLSPSGVTKQPANVKISKDNIQELIREELWGQKNE
jgi:uncharacterized damage-inducible protein DinB